MLTTLIINNFTIVSELHLDFEDGMTVFTGETGAGKSIMLDAINLLLGQRADPAVIRNGSLQCQLSAAFNVSTNPDALKWLKCNEIECASDEIILKRTININGRSKAMINGMLYPLQKIRELGDLLLHIHGQNEQYHLLKPEVHRAQLDAFAMNDQKCQKVKQSHEQLALIEKDISTLEVAAEQAAQRDLLNYQLDELRSLALQDGEVESLEAEFKRLSQASDFVHIGEKIAQSLASDPKDGLMQKIYQLQQMANDLPGPQENLTTFIELLNSAQIQLQEAQSEFYAYQKHLQVDPERLYEVEKRLSTIFDLARKHRVKPEALLTHQHQLETQLLQFNDVETRLAQLKTQQQMLLEQYHQQAKVLTNNRLKEAKALEKQITILIKTLGLPESQVKIVISPLDKPTANGLDKVEYYVTLNPGSKPNPLAKIASGGELSRISLAIQVLTAEKKAYPTLMFDEVDTGIGGATAAKVGQLLRRLGNHTQVFCVTHQAQVASNANWHMKVEKQIKQKQTFSSVVSLNQQQKINELARMISGVEMTEQTLAHAQALLEQVE